MDNINKTKIETNSNDIPDCWKPYLKCNHTPFYPSKLSFGSISFTECIGHKLDEKLFNILKNSNLSILHIWVFKCKSPGDYERWCIACDCIIEIDDNNIVTDIILKG